MEGSKGAKKYPELSLEGYVSYTKETGEELAFLAERIAQAKA